VVGKQGQQWWQGGSGEGEAIRSFAMFLNVNHFFVPPKDVYFTNTSFRCRHQSFASWQEIDYSFELE
jgi:hypothetical protein